MTIIDPVASEQIKTIVPSLKPLLWSQVETIFVQVLCENSVEFRPVVLLLKRDFGKCPDATH